MKEAIKKAILKYADGPSDLSLHDYGADRPGEWIIDGYINLDEMCQFIADEIGRPDAIELTDSLPEGSRWNESETRRQHWVARSGIVFVADGHGVECGPSEMTINRLGEMVASGSVWPCDIFGKRVTVSLVPDPRVSRGRSGS